MSRKSYRLQWVRRQLWNMYREEKDPDKRGKLWNLYYAAKDAEAEVDDIVRDAQMQGIRNPAFPHDLVGWLDDDFIIEEEDTYRGRQRKKEREEEEARKKAEEEAKNKKDTDEENKT